GDVGAVHGSLSLVIQGKARIANGGHVAELAQRFRARGVGGHADVHQALDAILQVERELVVELPRHAAAAERDAKDASQGGLLRRERYAGTAAGDSALAIARE